MSTTPLRVRFAPSPTGMFHVGGARSALYNWAVARQSGGTFVLRIEDTDAARNKPEWIDGIVSALAAIGIHGEDPAFEGPYFQSQNAERHREAGLRLFAEGRAY
ncbi:glutamate--tRNA ligase, partial [Streptomyces sp. SID11233]|nr:glutamate--tRNA ligase [Streptomyces sp. SID11233]